MLDPFNSENHFRWRLQCSKSEKMIWNGTTMTRCYWLGRRRPTPKVEVFSGRIFILLYTPEIVNYPDTEAALQERDCWKMSLDRIKTKVPAQSQGSLNFATHSHPGWMDGSCIQNCLCMCVCAGQMSLLLLLFSLAIFLSPNVFVFFFFLPPNPGLEKMSFYGEEDLWRRFAKSSQLHFDNQTNQKRSKSGNSKSESVEIIVCMSVPCQNTDTCDK